jgi:hypothetical protein
LALREQSLASLQASGLANTRALRALAELVISRVN